LGHTREAIAFEKAGILWPGCELVCGLRPPSEDPAAAVIAARAAVLGVPARFFPPQEGESLLSRNRRLAGAALEALGRRGLKDRAGEPLTAAWVADARPELPGRLEKLSSGGIPVVLDGAHTPGSLSAVLAELSKDPSLPGRPLVVFGAGRDKDHAALFSLLAGVAERVFCSSLGEGLASPSAELALKARAAGLDAENAPDPGVAMQRALAAATGRWVLVTGSLHLVGALRRQLRSPDP
jgi:dihydrofolate synthase/folylpolyglutamate synthase